jgi:type I restriction enzyme, S subunit
MNNWVENKINNVASLVKEKWDVGDKELPYLGLEHINEQDLRINDIGNSNQVASSKFIFNSDTFLFGKLRPYFRKLYRPKFEGICSTDIWVISPKAGFDKDFLFYFFANKEFVDFVNQGSSGTRMPRGDWNYIKESKWLFPPLTTQKAIAEVLSSLDDKIDLLHRQNKTLEQMAETLFRQWFVEEAGEDWEEKPLSQIADFLNGLACQKFPPLNNIDKLPVLKIKELKDGFTDNSDWVRNCIDNKYIVQNGDIIFSWSASLVVKIWDGEKCVLNQHLFKVTSPDYPKWFYYLWCQYHLKKFISIANAHATTMGHIKRSDLDNAMVIVPPDHIITNIDSVLEPIISKIVVNNNQISTLVDLRDSLLPNLISGLVKLNV